jgi:hypothetical protein
MGDVGGAVRRLEGMKKLIVTGGAIAAGIAGAAILTKRRAWSGGVDFERMIERMPEGAPPRWIYRNVSAIRENTERILHLLESESTSAEG